ncbi:MAG: DEAD/DEAH box helicase [Nocardioides sp.]
MIPSLVARELKASIVEYLATTFALSDDEAYRALTEFLLDETDGIFRGPYLRVRLPFIDAPPDADLGVAWAPAGFQPYAHQLAAWQRLAGRGQLPKPTLVTTGTGSGKSEAFLLPAIDHAIWARGRGQRGIKALVLYPMNALVTDQERRIAALLTDPTAQAAGVLGGVWIGDDGSVRPRRGMDGKHLISESGALQDDPPDILLTNYKMLDRLLTNPSRRRLWAANIRPSDDDGSWEQPLTYLVLDEFHIYDGAQGTDVAMLLRRLGHRLGTNTTTSPLTGVGCIGTSATLGSSPTAAADMCSFASRIFGIRFDATAVIGEQRRTVAEVCGDIDFALPVPVPEDLVALDPRDLDALAEAFTGEVFDDPQVVGDRLLRHRVTASMLRVAADRPRRWPDAVAGIAQQVPEWGAALARDADAVGAALERFVALVSQARGRKSSGDVRPLFSVEVQVWIREVTRLKRTVSRTPGFRWADSPFTDGGGLDLPSVYCTSCGRSGWLAVANRAGGQGAAAIERLVYDDGTDPYLVSVRDRERTRTMLRANHGEPDLLWLDPTSGQVHSADSDEATRIPVLVAGMTGDDRSEEARNEAAKRQQCPSCGSRDAIRFLGSRVTTLASVGITQMFGSDHVADDERKLLAFTDSVQDASHRAAFFSGRTHRFNLRATLSGALQSKGRVPLQRVAEVVLTRADQGDRPLDDIFSLVPPDLLWEGWLAAAWEAPGTPAALDARDGLAQRLAFDAILEAGLRARLGRTLETTGTGVAEILVTEEEWAQVVPFATEAIQASTGQLLTEPRDVRTWVSGVIERLRLRGGIFHPFLDRYLADHGKRWWIWGGGDPLAPKFPKGISAPAFFTSAPSDELDPISGTQSWLRLWSKKVLGIDGAGADQALRDLLHVLTDLGVTPVRSSSRGTIWGLPADRLEFVDIAPNDGAFPPTELRCDLCAHRHHTSPEQFDDWTRRPCLRLRCPGTYGPAATPPTNYYRHLYRSGRIRRVVAAEHTGMLTRKQRERVETGFKDGGRPDAPNVLAATPTLEMGIDIGDLSAVILTAVPPTQTNYVQRVGRAGRKTGNAFVTTFAEGDPRSLYFLHDPELMIAGDIVAPSCYLDAIEILRRQYLAFQVDQAAQGPDGHIPTAGDLPRTIGQLAATGLQPGGWMSVILEAGQDSELVSRFVRLFGSHLDAGVADRLASWAATDMRPHVERVIDRWRSHIQALANQRDRLREREKPLASLANPTAEDIETLGRIVAELRYVAGRINRAKGQDTLGALEALGLLPNYTLFDDTVTLEVSLWRPNDAHDPGDEQSRRFVSDGAEYARAASVAIRELAPGNYFYVNAHRVRIDAVDNGTEHEPAHSLWRFCPACAWATPDAAATVAACPRCGSPGVADQGSILTVLPMRVVSSTEREISARVGDDSEDRDREWHEVVTTVDIAPEDITAAFLHTKTVFGIEAARAARIRYLNVGLHASRSGQTRQVRIDGYDAAAALFTVCRHCGGVFGIRGDTRDEHDPNHHRSWCKVRSGARKEQWDNLVLAHELVTEAVRILLPVAEFEAVERVLSFKAALLLGLRDSFGGDPSHLRVLQTDFPAPGAEPDSRNRFVVVHDTVPGGTGYLPRLADPDRLREILTRAVDLIATCECQTRGQAGCHRCLYTAVGRHEIPLVSREVALDLLDELLTGWQLRPAEDGTITGVNLSTVRQSELERMFKALLHRWSANGPARVTSKPDPDHAALTRFDVRFQDGPHWELREQVNLVDHGTRPDFYATRVDATGTAPVAVYLDGWEHHGSDPDQVDLDSGRRASVRGGGTTVWTLTWQDVKAALTAASQGATVPAVLPLPNPVRHNAVQGAKRANGGDHPVFDAVQCGAFDQLMLYLAHPDATAWRHLAMTTALAAGSSGTALQVGDQATAVDQAARNVPIEPAGHETDIAALTWATQNGQLAVTVFERNGSPLPAAVTSHDTTENPDKDRWVDWLHMANLLQHLGDHAVITTTRTYPAGNPAAIATPAAATSHGGEDLLADVFDPAALPLARAATDAGWTQISVGYPSCDADDTPIEVVWPNSSVGILATGCTRPTTLTDWDLRTPGHWTEAELLAALAGGTP